MHDVNDLNHAEKAAAFNEFGGAEEEIDSPQSLNPQPNHNLEEDEEEEEEYEEEEEEGEGDEEEAAIL